METMIAGFKEVLGQGFVNATLGEKRIFIVTKIETKNSD